MASGYTREQWARALLAAIGNPNPSPYTLNWTIAWTDYETACCGGASYNLLNTIQTEPGSTPFNSSGVQNFMSFTQGIQANAQVLHNGLYPSLLAALSSNNDAALQQASHNGIAANLSTWGTGNVAAISAAASSGNVGGSQSFGGFTGFPPIGGPGTQQGPPLSTQSNGPNDPASCQAFCQKTYPNWQTSDAQNYQYCLVLCATQGTGGLTGQTGPLSGIAGAIAAAIGTIFSPIISVFSALGTILSWVTNPLRIIKLIAGFIMVGASLWLLVTDEGSKVNVTITRNLAKVGVK